MERDIQEAEPARWERRLERKGDGGDASAAAPASPPAVSEPADEAPPRQDEAESEGAEDLFGNKDQEGDNPAAALSAAVGDEVGDHDSGTATGSLSCDSSLNSLSHHLCSVDM